MTKEEWHYEIYNNGVTVFNIIGIVLCILQIEGYIHLSAFWLVLPFCFWIGSWGILILFGLFFSFVRNTFFSNYQ